MPQTNGIPTTTQDKINAMDGFCLFSIFYFVLNTFFKIILIQIIFFITIVLKNDYPLKWNFSSTGFTIKLQMKPTTNKLAIIYMVVLYALAFAKESVKPAALPEAI
jgi:hypothetical protein